MKTLFVDLLGTEERWWVWHHCNTVAEDTRNTSGCGGRGSGTGNRGRLPGAHCGDVGGTWPLPTGQPHQHPAAQRRTGTDLQSPPKLLFHHAGALGNAAPAPKQPGSRPAGPRDGSAQGGRRWHWNVSAFETQRMRATGGQVPAKTVRGTFGAGLCEVSSLSGMAKGLRANRGLSFSSVPSQWDSTAPPSPSPPASPCGCCMNTPASPVPSALRPLQTLWVGVCLPQPLSPPARRAARSPAARPGAPPPARTAPGPAAPAAGTDRGGQRWV